MTNLKLPMRIGVGIIVLNSKNKVQKLTIENGVYSFPIWNNIGDRIVFVKASENEFDNYGSLGVDSKLMWISSKGGINNFIDKTTGKKINDETMRLLEIQKDSMVKFLMKIPKLYYTKSHFPLEISQRAFDHLWRVCESYEMWCKETKQKNLIILNISD